MLQERDRRGAVGRSRLDLLCTDVGSCLPNPGIMTGLDEDMLTGAETRSMLPLYGPREAVVVGAELFWGCGENQWLGEVEREGGGRAGLGLPGRSAV